MNNTSIERFSTRVGCVSLLAVFGAGCSGGAGSIPGANASAVTSSSRVATEAARSGQKIYVATVDGASIVVYSAGNNPTLLQTITDGTTRPNGVWVGANDRLYAVNVPRSSYQTSLPEYKSGASAPSRIITSGIVNASEVAVDGEGNVYVTGFNTSSEHLYLEIYAKGSMVPTQTLTVPGPQLSAVEGLAFDSTGALLVGEAINEGDQGEVLRLAPGSQTFTNLNLEKAPGGSIAVDSKWNLYVGGNTGIDVYPMNSTHPSRHFIVRHGVSALAVDSRGGLYVGSYEGMLVYPPHARKPTLNVRIPGHVGGIALSN